MEESRAVPELRELALEEIEPNLDQPRQYFDKQALQELAASVRERGILQPVFVRPLEDGMDGKYQLVAGERRWRAAKLAGLQTIPALVSQYEDLPALEVGLIENMARQDLNPIEEARACVTLVQELGLTYQQLASRVGRSKSRVANLIRLLKLPDEIIELMERGELSKSHGEALLLAQDPRVRGALAREAVEQGWSVPTLKARAHESNLGEPKPKEDPEEVGLEGERERERYAGQARERDAELQPDLTAMEVARVWGDLLGVGVGIRSLRGGKLRLEVDFTSAEAALNVGGDLAEQVARAKKRR
jgi:ParB family chromosome partitioning protein